MLIRMNSSACPARQLCEDSRVPTVEGKLLRKWRESRELTQKRLGQLCTRKVDGSRIRAIETGDSSASVSTLLNVIAGLEKVDTKLGKTDPLRLARFFQGPELDVSKQEAARSLHALADEIASR